MAKNQEQEQITSEERAVALRAIIAHRRGQGESIEPQENPEVQQEPTDREETGLPHIPQIGKRLPRWQVQSAPEGAGLGRQAANLGLKVASVGVNNSLRMAANAGLEAYDLNRRRRSQEGKLHIEAHRRQVRDGNSEVKETVETGLDNQAQGFSQVAGSLGRIYVAGVTGVKRLTSEPWDIKLKKERLRNKPQCNKGVERTLTAAQIHIDDLANPRDKEGKKARRLEENIETGRFNGEQAYTDTTIAMALVGEHARQVAIDAKRRHLSQSFRPGRLEMLKQQVSEQLTGEDDNWEGLPQLTEVQKNAVSLSLYLRNSSLLDSDTDSGLSDTEKGVLRHNKRRALGAWASEVSDHINNISKSGDRNFEDLGMEKLEDVNNLPRLPDAEQLEEATNDLLELRSAMLLELENPLDTSQLPGAEDLPDQYKQMLVDYSSQLQFIKPVQLADEVLERNIEHRLHKREVGQQLDQLFTEAGVLQDDTLKHNEEEVLKNILGLAVKNSNAQGRLAQEVIRQADRNGRMDGLAAERLEWVIEAMVEGDSGAELEVKPYVKTKVGDILTEGARNELIWTTLLPPNAYAQLMAEKTGLGAGGITSEVFSRARGDTHEAVAGAIIAEYSPPGTFEGVEPTGFHPRCAENSARFLSTLSRRYSAEEESLLLLAYNSPDLARIVNERLGVMVDSAKKGGESNEKIMAMGKAVVATNIVSSSPLTAEGNLSEIYARQSGRLLAELAVTEIEHDQVSEVDNHRMGGEGKDKQDNAQPDFDPLVQEVACGLMESSVQTMISSGGGAAAMDLLESAEKTIQQRTKSNPELKHRMLSERATIYDTDTATGLKENPTTIRRHTEQVGTVLKELTISMKKIIRLQQSEDETDKDLVTGFELGLVSLQEFVNALPAEGGSLPRGVAININDGRGADSFSDFFARKLGMTTSSLANSSSRGYSEEGEHLGFTGEGVLTKQAAAVCIARNLLEAALEPVREEKVKAVRLSKEYHGLQTTLDATSDMGAEAAVQRQQMEDRLRGMHDPRTGSGELVEAETRVKESTQAFKNYSAAVELWMEGLGFESRVVDPEVGEAYTGQHKGVTLYVEFADDISPGLRKVAQFAQRMIPGQITVDDDRYEEVTNQIVDTLKQLEPGGNSPDAQKILVKMIEELYQEQ